MKIYYESIRNADIVYSATLDTNFPVTNIQDLNIHTFAKDTAIGVSSVNFDIDYGASHNADYILLGNYSLTASDEALMLVYGSNNGSAWTGIGSGVTVTSAALTNYLYKFSSTQNYRYYRVMFFDSTGTLTDLQIGNILIGVEWELATNPEINKVKSSGFDVTVNQGSAGARFGKRYTEEARRIYEYNFTKINATELGKWEDLRDSIKIGDLSQYPFYFTEDTILKCVRMRGNLSVTESAFRAWDLSTTFETEI